MTKVSQQARAAAVAGVAAAGLLAGSSAFSSPLVQGSTRLDQQHGVDSVQIQRPSSAAHSSSLSTAALGTMGAAAVVAVLVRPAMAERTRRVHCSLRAEPKSSFDPAVQVGAMPPLGYFDPAGFSKKGDESGFRTLRAAEIKHGRVAMMAALGAVVQHYVKFPGFEQVPSGLSAVLTPPGSYGMVALFLVSGALELGVWTEDPSKEPGNFGDPAGLGQYTQEFRERELNNGRFAMFAAIGIISAELLTGKDAIEQFGL